VNTQHLELCARAFLLSILFVVAPSNLWAQSPQATITGTISDVQGARVPGATVTALHVATNQKFTGVSSSDGVYAVPSLPIGEFEVAVTAPGFSTSKQTGVVLEVAQRLRLDMTLQIGEVNNTVTVTESVSRVQTEASSLGATIERKRIENLPLNGRHVLDLVKLVPGVQPRVRGTDGFAQVDNQAFSQISFNGGPTYGNQIYLDGGMNTVPVHNELGVVPLLDSVEEFKVHTNALAAEFGQSNGGVISFVTKSGTNQFHGSLYEFLRNDALDARNAFLTQRDPITGRTKPVLRFNQYGGTFGGPLFLPRFGEGGPVFRSGRDRTFFFVGYERWNHRQANINRATVPTPAERNGDFSNTRDGTGRLITIYDPATTRPNPNGSGFIRDPFPGNVIPRTRMDPLSLRVLEFMPLPNVAPNNPFTNSQNYLSLQGFPTDQGEFSLRIDHNIGEKDRIFGRYTGTRNTRMNRQWGLGPADTDARDDQRDNHNVIIGQTHVFSPSVLNEFRANATRQYLIFVHPSFDQGWPARLGFPAIFPQDAFPPVQIDGLLAIGAARGGFAGGHRLQHSIQIADSLTWTRGHHVIKMGTDQRWIRLNFVNRVNPSGNFTFASALTNSPQSPAGTGVGFATFLLGEVSGGSQSVRPFFSFHSWSNGSYVQDDFKVTRRLTLNLGLRYDLYSGPVERWNRSSNLDPFTTNPESGLPGVLQYAGVTKDRHFTLPPKSDFSPRIGFVYDLTGDGKTAVRAGYGIIYSGLDSGDTAGDNANSLGFSIDTTFVAPGGGPFKAFQFSQGPATLLQPRGASGGPSAFRGQNVTYQELKAPTPYVQQWNLTVQRELPWQWVLSATYAGNRGVHLFGANYDLNQLDPKHFSLGLALQDQVTNPFFGQITSGALSGRTVARSQLLRPYPDYLNIRTLANHGAASTYHSFQLIGEKRFSHGLAAMVSYTTAKLINDSAASNQGNGGGGDFRIGRLDRRQDRALDEGDVSQRLVVSSVYELPFGPGRRFLKEGTLSHLIGGWQLNTIVTWETGRPLVVRGANNFTGINWPDMVCNPTLPASERSADSWFKTECFRNPPNFVIGNVPRTLPSTRGPGYQDLSLSVFRNFNFTERVKMEFRGEAFNAFNFVNFNEPNTTFMPNAQGVNTNPNFGRVLGSFPARRIQFGLRLAF
jgi:outer membrane receptor protein involved in Fe transport